MSQSLAQIYLHIVFSTKKRQRLLQDRELRQELHRYLAGICHNQKCPALAIGGVADHVHVFCRLGRTMSVSDLVRELKRDSSKWLKGQRPDMSVFDWQDGYAAFSISPVHVDLLKVYIATQEEHHKTESFKDELLRLFRKYQIEYDERYLWE